MPVLTSMKSVMPVLYVDRTHTRMRHFSMNASPAPLVPSLIWWEARFARVSYKIEHLLNDPINYRCAIFYWYLTDLLKTFNVEKVVKCKKILHTGVFSDAHSGYSLGTRYKEGLSVLLFAIANGLHVYCKSFSVAVSKWKSSQTRSASNSLTW